LDPVWLLELDLRAVLIGYRFSREQATELASDLLPVILERAEAAGVLIGFENRWQMTGIMELKRRRKKPNSG